MALEIFRWKNQLEEKDMASLSRLILKNALGLASEINAEAVLFPANTLDATDDLWQLVNTGKCRAILIDRRQVVRSNITSASCERITVPDVHLSRFGQIKVALLACLAEKLLKRGDQVICLIGIDGSDVIDTCMVLKLGSEQELFWASDDLNLGGDISPAVFERTMSLAIQLAVEGREGRRVGAIFVVGDSDTVLAQSRLLVLNPFHGYPESMRNIIDPTMEDTVKEFAAIDGAFIVRGDGIIITAGSLLLPTASPPELAKGLGTRHAAAAAITASTAAAAIVVSQSTGTVTIFKSGHMLTSVHKPAN